LSLGCFHRRFTRRNALKSAFGAVSARLLGGNAAAPGPDAALNIPARDPQALTGSQFAASVESLDRDGRERAILKQLVEGNLPGFARRLAPVRMSYRTIRGATVAATIFVMPEYLAIGSERDFLRIPMNLYTARAVADQFQCVLPTKKIVDAIYAQSPYHFIPQPMPAGPQMRSTEYYEAHNAMIDKQSQARGIPLGPLVSGHKKDVVLTNLLARRPSQIAIYGWHRSAGDPIQPLSTVHGAHYADYSHGIRLVSQAAMVDGVACSVHDILCDSTLAYALSDEGPLREVLDLWAREPVAGV
jgi:hypothetical protein